MSNDHRIHHFPGARRPSRASGALPDVGDDPSLRELLAAWTPPPPAESLEVRLIDSYRAAIAARPRTRSRRRTLLSIAATFMAGAIAWWVVSAVQGPSVSAAELLAASTRAEATRVAQPDRVVRRRLSIEERRLPEGTLVSRRRVEVLQHGGRGLLVRRVYDEQDRLIGGEWVARRGARTVYRPGRRAESSTESGLPGFVDAAAAGDAWRFDLSASAFAGVAPLGRAAVERRADGFVLTWHGAADGRIAGALLVLSNPDLRPLIQTFTVRESATRLREIRFAEIDHEDLPAAAVPAVRFEPNSSLLGIPMASRPSSVASRAPTARTAATPLADDLELDAWHRLHMLGLVFGENAFVSRTAEGVVRLRIGVDREHRHNAMAQRLAPLVRRSVIVEFDEPRAASPVVWQHDAEGSALFRRLHDHFTARVPPGAATAEEAATAARTSIAAARAGADRQRARIAALRAFVERWPVAGVAMRSADTMAQWSTVVRDHALAIGEEAERLRQGSLPLIHDLNESNPDPRGAVTGLSELASRLPELINRAAAAQASLDAALGATPSAQGVDVRALAIALRDVEALARTFAGPWDLGRQ